MSTIKLYRNCQIVEEKNFQVDNLEDYLNSLLPIKIFDNVQYIKQGLDAEVKVGLDQTYLDKEWTNMFNYCSIENVGGQDNTYYYFIRDMKWISKDAVKLILHLDVVNTFKDAVKLSEKTTIQRQHKDRFIKVEDFRKLLYTWTDNFTEWDWGTQPGELIGKATFNFGDDFIGRDVNINIRETRSPHMIDAFDYTWDKDFAELKITAYHQHEYDPIPQSEVEIDISTVPAHLSDELIRKIDKVSEGINPVLWNKNKDELLKEEINTVNGDTINMGDSTWYITYKTNTEYNSDKPDDFIYNNAINTFITADTYDLTVNIQKHTIISLDDIATKVRQQAVGRHLIVSFPVGADGKHMPNSFSTDYDESYLSKIPMRISVDLIDSNDNVVKTFNDLHTEYVSKTNHKRLKQTVLEFSYTTTAGNPVKMYFEGLKRDNFIGTEDAKNIVNFADYPGCKLRFNNISSVKLFTTTLNASPNYYDAYVRHPGNPAYYEFSGGEFVPATLMNFNHTDRSSQKLVKIINVPYSPVDINNNTLLYNESEQQLSLDKAAFKYDPSFNHMIKLNVDPLDIYESGEAEAYTPISDMYIKVNADKDALRNDIYESKLYHSDFSQVKFVYDSFSYVFRNELLDINAMKMLSAAELVGDDYIYVDYDVSNSVSSAFGFNFNTCYPLAAQYEDYNVMVVNRNLEMPIYNNYYLNYLRSGALSADKKANQTQQVAAGLGAGLSAVGLGLGIGLSFVPGANAMAPATIATSAVGLAGSLTGTIVNSVQADRALQQKLEQARQQAASVAGSDDIGLLRWYTPSNLCKLVKYGLSDTSKDRIADLFYYCGYRCDYQAKPDVNSRYWFNFIQCEPVFEVDHLTAKMSKDCRNELIEKYKAGITVLHGHYIPEDDEFEYDFDQVKENWENWLIR